MGTMGLYKCKKCGHTKELHLGIGMMYPRVSGAVKESIANGDAGAEAKAAFNNCELPAVRPEDEIYVCTDCGYWDVYRDMSVYEPVDVNTAKKKQYGIKTAEEWGGIPYLMDYEIESGEFRCVYRYVPECPECGGGMLAGRDYSDVSGATTLKCPDCGAHEGVIDDSGFWD